MSVLVKSEVTHCTHRETFMMSPPAMSLGDRFCMSGKAGQGEVGVCTQRL